jgi:hypothetical protein
MLNRRTFLSAAAGSLATSGLASAQQPSAKAALYANVGPALTRYEVDVANAELTKRETVMLPAGVQYAWPHASRRYLYVATSSSASGYGPTGTEHHVTAFAVDPATGALTPHGAPIRLPHRPIHCSTDIPSEHILVAFNSPSAVRVYRINKDFSPGEEVAQPGPIDAGIFAHQVRTTPDNRLTILVTRGKQGTPTKAEDPGALKVFDYKNGLLTNNRAQWRERVRPAAPRLPPLQTLDVCVNRNAEQNVHVFDGSRQDQSRDCLPRGNIGRAGQTSGPDRRPAPFTSTRTADFCTGPIGRRRPSSFKASKSSEAARTASSRTRSTNPPESRRRSSTSRRKKSTRALFTSTERTPAGRRA